jgi:hypothetical protein
MIDTPVSPDQGDGFVVLIDGARFLPSSATITKATATVWSAGGRQLSGAIEGVALPDGEDAASPCYWVQGAVGQGAERFEDPTATIMLQVWLETGHCCVRAGCAPPCGCCPALGPRARRILRVGPREQRTPRRVATFARAHIGQRRTQGAPQSSPTPQPPTLRRAHTRVSALPCLASPPLPAVTRAVCAPAGPHHRPLQPVPGCGGLCAAAGVPRPPGGQPAHQPQHQGLRPQPGAALPQHGRSTAPARPRRAPRFCRAVSWTLVPRCGGGGGGGVEDR